MEIEIGWRLCAVLMLAILVSVGLISNTKKDKSKKPWPDREDLKEE